MTTARVTQQAVEALLEGAPRARASQQAAEALLTGQPLARATLVALEVLHATALAPPPASTRRPVMILCVAG